MKKTYSALPASMKNMEMYGFHWMEFVLSIPSPLYIVTLIQKQRAVQCLYAVLDDLHRRKKIGYFAIVSAVSKYGHLYQTLYETGEAVINFMSADLYDRCMSTCRNNGFDTRRNRGGRP